MPAWLRTVVKVLKFAWKYRDSIENAVDPEPKGQPLTFKDVERQQAQIRAAARPKD